MIYPCENCRKRPAEHLHHIYSQSLYARRMYPDFIDDSKNIMKLCSICHLNKGIKKYNELEFCKVMGIEPQGKIKGR